MDIDLKNLPEHIAIIMDGNGRWAQQRNLPRTQGHIEGVKRVEEIVDTATALGIKVVTLFTFSSENWSRPESEVAILMRIVATVLEKKLDKFQKDNIRFFAIGRREHVPPSLLEIIDRVIQATRNNTGVTMNMALNYGGRTEIIDATRAISRRVRAGELDPEEISEKVIAQELYTRDFPDPDLLIRTSGEKRISNFLLWQLSYTELYFTDKLWPDFTAEEFKKAIVDYQHRERRFGHL